MKAVHPDYTAIREQTLKKLKVGSQSAAGKAVDAFIREVERVSPPATPTDAQNPPSTDISTATAPKSRRSRKHL